MRFFETVIKALVSKLTMRRQECLFVDRVDGKEVFRYVDCYGAEWLAQSQFGFRVAR